MEERLKKLQKLNFDLQNKDFLLTWEKSRAEIEAVLNTAVILKEMHKQNIACRIFDSGLAISIFKDNSTRTRLSYASAANSLGLAVQDLDETKSQVAHGETVRETANMISFMADVIGIRDDIFIGEGDKYQRQVAAAVDFGYQNGILDQRPAVINLQSDIDHPTQSLADLAKMCDKFGSIDNLKGKKVVMSWAYSPTYGKPLSVAQGTIGLLSRFGTQLVLAHPPGYDLLPEIIERASQQAQASGGSFQITNDMQAAFQDADIVCPKSWASFAVMQQRKTLLHNGDKAGLANLEQTCLQENAKYKDWECTSKLMKLTNKALYMHPLPADISGVNCEHGEVSKQVFEENLYDTYTQAGFKPFIIAAMIFLIKQNNPTSKLEELLNKKIQRLDTRRK
ncbi:MAG: hypothetical protein PWQ09_164 [Candidatus Cloacimonadota bacterium]|jgi:knotted carbamoyltransferase YgeW|nr:hypothetical protein [Candidatus Cloacimonadota bacterium]